MPRRNRRRIVGKWEQIERQAREDELKELEAEVHREWHEQAPSKRPNRQKHKVKPTAQPEPAPKKQDRRSGEPPDITQ